jgi:beta-lactamase class A
LIIAVEMSDNTAANVLLRFIGGSAALTRNLRTIGDHTTRLDRMEPSLNSNLPGDPRDTTTPSAMIATMHNLLVGNALSEASRGLLLTWLKGCQTGLHRLRAGLSPTWTAGDKTGTGENGAVNDNAIVWPPRRAPILIAAYLSGSHASAVELDAAHARIGALVAAEFSVDRGP